MRRRFRTFSADAAYTKGDYNDAVPLYKKAFGKEKNKAKKAEILFKTGECYRQVNDYKNQQVWYEKAKHYLPMTFTCKPLQHHLINGE